MISELHLCEGRGVSPTVFKTDIKLSLDHISCFTSVCPFGALSKATFAENVHIVYNTIQYNTIQYNATVFILNENYSVTLLFLLVCLFLLLLLVVVLCIV